MEKLVEAGLIGGVLDITTTEVADHLAGGVFPCGAERFESILKARVPYVLSTGRWIWSTSGRWRPCRNRSATASSTSTTLR